MIRLNGVEYDSVSYLADPKMRESLNLQATAAEKEGKLPPGINTAYGYVMLVLAGIDRGLSPTAAISTLNYVGGRFTMSAQAMVGFAMVHGGVVTEFLETSEERAVLRFSREGQPTREVEFSIEEAKKAGLYPGKENSGWRKWTKDMLVARAITRGLRYIAADIVTGLYSTEEMMDGEKTVDYAGLTAEQIAEGNVDYAKIAAAAGVTTPAAGGLVPAGTAAKPPPAPETAPSTSAATAFQQALPGKVVAAELDLTPGEHITLTTQGKLPNITETSKAIFAVFSEIYNPDMAKSVLKQKVEGYGAESVSKLSPIDFMDLYRWADAQVQKAKHDQPTVEEVAEQQAGEVAAPNPIPAFNPHRGAATQGAGAVADGSAPQASLDDQIKAAWQALAAVDREAEADVVFDKYGYEVGAEGLSQQIRRLVLQELQALTTQAA